MDVIETAARTAVELKVVVLQDPNTKDQVKTMRLCAKEFEKERFNQSTEWVKPRKECEAYAIYEFWERRRRAKKSLRMYLEDFKELTEAYMATFAGDERRLVFIWRKDAA